MKKPPVSKRLTNAKTSPQYFTPAQVQSLLHWTRQLEPELLAYFAIGAFAGARRREILLLDWRDIDLVGGVITIRAERNSMSPRPRYLKICDNLAAWLSLCHQSAGPVIGQKVAKSLKRRRLAVCSHAGIFEWPSDVLRRTFGTYRITFADDFYSVMSEMGHRTRPILKAPLRRLVSSAEAKAYFEILPLGHPLATAPLTLLSQAPAMRGEKPAELIP